MATNDVVLNKVATIERCIQRIHDEYDNNFENNLTKQDAIILNLQRAAETAIDLGTHIIRDKKLGLPQTSREVFDLLEKANIISTEICTNMKKMVGFRNIAVHDYTRLNLAIIKNIIELHIEDFLQFTKAIFKST